MQKKVCFGSDEPLISLVMPCLCRKPTELLLALSSSRLHPSWEERLYIRLPDDSGANEGTSETVALLQRYMTPVGPSALIVPAAAPTSATSKTGPKPLNSSHTRPGAYTQQPVLEGLWW
jgi:hypothetical protein